MSNESSHDLVAIWPAEMRFVNLVWQVSDVCNFRCSYCNPGIGAQIIEI